MFKVLLCIPPDYDRNYPPLGTPALNAFLKKNDVSCSQTDLNLGYRDFLARSVSSASGLTLEEQRFFLEPLLKKYFNENLQGRYYSSLLPGANNEASSYLPYGNNTNSSFYFSEQLLSSGHLWRYLEDKEENTFYRFYESSGICDRLEKERISLLGISVISPTQAIASLTLGLLIKKRFPRIHVTIGGQWVTLYRDAILEKKELFRCFDSMIVFEGESALCALVRRLEAGQEISSIPNVIVQSAVAGAGLSSREEDMDLLPCPDFDGLPIREYDGSRDGEISLTFETSRGCYWSKCAYCVDLPLPKPSYRRKGPALAVNDMQELRKRYGAGYLLFGDPGLSPRQMLELSQEILKKRLDIGWWTMARLDPGFNRKLFDLARRAGLRQVNFGFESANDRVCGLLDKGNMKARSSRIIKDCAAAGIKVDLQTMLGLPGEKFEDGLETIDFLVSHKDSIAHTTFNTYYLTPFNYVHQDPVKYGIDYDRRPDMPFRFFIPFRNMNGMGKEEAALLEKIYRSLMGRSGTAEKAACRLTDGQVELALNGETCSLRYRRDAAAESYTFI
jgi:radical SAM superfamily enzyme YgiQ (UPF0313 family)